MELCGASAIVTGGASGIGAASARALTARGARCVLLDLNEELGKQVAADLDGIYVHADVTDEAEVQRAVDAASDLGPLRALVNAAGIGNAIRTVDRERGPFPLDRFEKIVRVNLIGTFNCLRLAAAAMAKTQPVDADGARGAIVNLSSVAAFDGQIGQAAYAASKAGVVGLTLPVARDLSVYGIRVNTIAPGLIDTPMWGQGERADAFKGKVGASVLYPARLGTPDELASMVVELVTNDYMNGETIRVDGGIRMPPR
jgi:NAD(P)-dependent dehydrogenase (short-subunit alcohol dehydrogenase family)